MKNENPEEREENEVRLVRGEVDNSGDPLLIATESLARESLMRERGYWLNMNIYPQYGMLRRSNVRKVLIDVWLEDGEIESDMAESVNMFGRNQLGCQDSKCVCAQVKEFAIGGEVAKSMRSGRMVRRASIDIEAIRRISTLLTGRSTGFHYGSQMVGKERS